MNLPGSASERTIVDGGRPLLRGWPHALAIGPAIAGTVYLVDQSTGNPVKQFSLFVYGLTLVALYSISAAYHIRLWRPRYRAVLRRFDRSAIFVMIAGTYTPIVVNELRDPARTVALLVIWVLALVGVVTVVGQLALPHGARTGLYLALGWISVALAPLVAARVGWFDLVYLVAGGVLYSLGAVTYGLKRPRLWSSVFGYHEIFHLLGIAANAAFFIFMVRDVVPFPAVR